MLRIETHGHVAEFEEVVGGRKETLVGALLGAEEKPIPGQTITLPAGEPYALFRGTDYPYQFLGQ
jgi:hypothetical protein